MLVQLQRQADDSVASLKGVCPPPCCVCKMVRHCAEPSAAFLGASVHSIELAPAAVVRFYDVYSKQTMVSQWSARPGCKDAPAPSVQSCCFWMAAA